MTHADQRQPDCRRAGVTTWRYQDRRVGGDDLTNVRSAPTSGAKADIAGLLLWADAVEKVRKCLVAIFSKEAQLNHPRRLNMAPRPLSKSPVSFSLRDEVPHIVIRESHQRPKENFDQRWKKTFSTASAMNGLQLQCSKTVH
jgi:hypothetical protein